ncbi:MAG: 30S ribosomal protein S2 [Gammaproteobacteria bacterium]
MVKPEADITMSQMVKSGVHFGHRRRFWNPAMAPYIHSTYQKVDIIDLRQTKTALIEACDYLRNLTSRGGRVLFIGTKRSARPIIKEQALIAGMPYINNRWLGGTLTNWKTIRGCITKMERLEKEVVTKREEMTKKELLMHQRAIDKLRINLEGIRTIGGLPNALFVIDVQHEAIAISEAQKMGIPVVGVVDTNSNPASVTHLIPANDDSRHSIQFVTSTIAAACADGLQSVSAN